MPKESHIRDAFRTLVTRDLAGHVTNHEDRFNKGIADASFAFRVLPGHELSRVIHGWVEFKHEHKWPKLWSTQIKIGLSPEQRIWIMDRFKHARDVFIIVRIDKDIYMFSGRNVTELYYGVSRDKFEDIWLGKWKVKINIKEFIEICNEQLP